MNFFIFLCLVGKDNHFDVNVVFVLLLSVSWKMKDEHIQENGYSYFVNVQYLVTLEAGMYYQNKSLGFPSNILVQNSLSNEIESTKLHSMLIYFHLTAQTPRIKFPNGEKNKDKRQIRDYNLSFIRNVR